MNGLGGSRPEPRPRPFCWSSPSPACPLELEGRAVRMSDDDSSASAADASQRDRPEHPYERSLELAVCASGVCRREFFRSGMLVPRSVRSGWTARDRKHIHFPAPGGAFDGRCKRTESAIVRPRKITIPAERKRSNYFARTFGFASGRKGSLSVAGATRRVRGSATLPGCLSMASWTVIGLVRYGRVRPGTVTQKRNVSEPMKVPEECVHQRDYQT